MLAAVLLTLTATAFAAPAPSKVWPMADEGAAWMIERLPNAENLGYPVGEKTASPLAPGYYAVVEVPAYLELYSSTFAYSREMPAPRVQDVTREGRTYRHYTFAPLTGRNYERWASFFTHWVPRPTEADRRQPGVFAWHFETPDGAETEQALPIKLLPELPEFAAPRRLQVRLWQSSIMNVQPAKLPEVLTLLQRSGFNTVPWWESTVDNLVAAGARQRGLKIAADQSGHAGWPDMRKPSPAPEYQNRDCEGKPLEDQDPQWIIDEGGAPWKNDLAYCSRHAAKVDVLSEDIEWNTEGFRTGFSPAGLRAFAQRAKLDATGLTPQSVWRDHRRAWNDFRAWQTLELVKLYYRAAKAGNPRVFFEFLPGSPYSTTEANELSELVPLDKDPLGRLTYLMFPFPLRDMPQAMDAVMPMWYGHGISQTRESFAWSRALSRGMRVPLLPCLLGQGREFYYTGGDPGEALRAMNLAAVLGGSRGLCYWLGEFSPLQLSWLARGYRELAAVEDLLLDGRPDCPGLTVTPLPQKTFTLVCGTQQRRFPVPDFAGNVLWRGFARGDRRLLGLINLDPGLEAYYRLCCRDLPAGRYRVSDRGESLLVTPDARQAAFTAAELKKGIVLRTHGGYGVGLVAIEPDKGSLPAGLTRLTTARLAADYAKYRQPDTTGAVLAERAGLSIRYDIVGADAATAVLIESPLQQVWVRLQSGGRVSDWKIRDGNRTAVSWLPPYGGAAADLFWSPPEAHWAGDEVTAYELLEAKIHGGKAYLRLRQKKQAPALQGLVVTKTIVVPADRTDLEVSLTIANEGPAPELGFSAWAHHEFQLGLADLEKSEPRQHPQVFLRAASGATEAPCQELVWAKPGAAYLPGNETWEKQQRNGETTGDWIAQRNPVTGETLLCQVDSPAVTQFYSWRDAARRDDLSVEWMYPYVKLPAGQSWQTSYVLRYLKSATPEQLQGRLLPPPGQ